MGNFSIDISRFVEKSKGRIDTIVKKVTLDVFSSVISMSPVDTGRFRGNWVASIGSYGNQILSVTDKSGDGTISEASRVVNNGNAGTIMYLVNNLPYAQRLEYGYSNQAPSGMIRVTIANYQDYVRKASRVS